MEVLSPIAIQNIKQQIRTLESQLNESDIEAGSRGRIFFDKVQFKDRIEQQIRYLKTRLENGTPKTLSDSDKDKMWKRRKELEERISSGMKEFGLSRDGLRDTQNGQNVMRYEDKYGKDIHEFRQINRQLEPDNMGGGCVEHLRKGGAEGRRTRPIPGMTK
jgi:hypothetical protein